ncbi:MAG: hypothetical protein JWO22_1665, partial [Frankiales bacterium]|nr:hypothetical protein [Frankiales bacterium]
VQVKVGQTLVSTVDSTSVVVIRAPQADVDLGCGGAPMVDKSELPAELGAVAADLSGGSLVGKRYADEAHGLELLCTKGGTATLTVDGRPIEQMDAKALPATD